MARDDHADDHDPFRIERASPLDADLALLFDRHAHDMHVDTPAGSNHMLGREALSAPGIAFYVMRGSDGVPCAMGAIKARPGSTEGEIKSMHVLAEHRGGGLSRLLLDKLLIEARAAGITQLHLETGAQASFAAARALYARSGFRECDPFWNYADDANSVFMTRAL